MRRPHASGDLAHPNRIHQCTDRVSMRSEHQPKCLLHSHKLAYVQIGSWRHPGIPPILDIGAGIKSP
jgi:hypothetical protein